MKRAFASKVISVECVYVLCVMQQTGFQLPAPAIPKCLVAHQDRIVMDLLSDQKSTRWRDFLILERQVDRDLLVEQGGRGFRTRLDLNLVR